MKLGKFVTLAAALRVWAAVFPEGGSAKTLHRLHLGFDQFVGDLLIAKEAGIFKEHGLDLELISSTAACAVCRALSPTI
jgi:hypothetical protein